MSIQADSYAELPAEAYQPYRAVSKAAVASLMLALVSLLAFLVPVAAILALAGLITGLCGWAAIRRYPLELTGKSLAFAGTGLSSFVLLGATALHTYIYLTEVPEGYQRISFADLQPTGERPELPVSPTALKLDGQRVFIKGYVYPDGQQHSIRQFVLVPDMGTCCFGGQPKLTDMVQVTLADPLTVDYSLKKRKLAGTLKVDMRLKPVSGLQGVYYELEADYVR